MDSPALASGDRSRTNWTPPMDRYFIDLLLDQVRSGNKRDHVFNKQAWEHMIASFNTKFGFQYDMDVLKNRYKKLRKLYNDIKFLLDQSGFSWDETRQIVTADDGVWDDYIKEHPDARSYKTKIVPYYNDLCVIYGNATVDGKYSRSGHDVDLDHEEKGMDSPAPASTGGDRPRIDWTPTMDRYFVDLMLDQVQKGNKIGHSFKKKAWSYMITSFNTKFGSQHNKDVLRSRYATLRRQYNTIKILLNQSGFSWDETRQLVTADDSVWDNYIKAHPNARVYRNKILPYYDGLCLIYGTADGNDSSGHNVDFDNGIPRMKIGGVSRGLQSLAMPDGRRDSDDEAHDESSPSPQHSKKARRSTDEGMANALRDMVAAVTSLTNKNNENDDSTTIENVIDALQTLPDIDEDLLLDACDFLEDERKAKTFLALDVTLRKKWLMRKLRPEQPQ